MQPLIAQRRGFDCGIAALAMLCHLDYADVFFVAALVAGKKLREGLTVKQLAAVSRRLKRPLVPIHWRKVDLDEDTGVLGLCWNNRPAWASGHWVVLRRGTIIDPDPERYFAWDADEYMKTNKARPGTLLMERD